MPLYLADSSIWIGRRRAGARYLQRLFLERLGRGQIATCVPVALEVLDGATDRKAYADDWLAVWQLLVWLPLSERTTGRALEVQSELADKSVGAHPRCAAEYLIAAYAEDAGPDVVLWHWDANLTAICEHTGQPHESEHERAYARGLD